MNGKTANEITTVVGPPSSTSLLSTGETVMLWQAVGYHMGLLFDADGRFVKIIQQYAQEGLSQQGEQTKSTSRDVLGREAEGSSRGVFLPSTLDRWAAMIKKKFRAWWGPSANDRGIANNPWVALMMRPDAKPTEAINQGNRQTTDAKTLAIEREKENKRKSESLLGKHRDLIEKFLGITERKVSALDEYGDENWDVLPNEIERCLGKIAKREQATYRVWPVQKRTPQTLQNLQFQYRSEYCYLAMALVEEFRAHHSARRSAESSKQDVEKLTGVDFENYVANLLKESGYVVSGTPVTGDQGADLIAKKGGRTIAVQAKGWKGAVSNGAVQEIVAALKFYRADEGWVITNSVFTPSARQLAQANNITLIDGHDLKMKRFLQH